MLVHSISLGNYRNYKVQEVNFHPACNVFEGENAQGKTNLLEAILYTLTGKSHRTKYDQDLISWGEKFFYVALKGERYSRNVKIEISVRSDGKKLLKVNNQPKKRLSDILGVINVVLFSPEDMMLVKGSPSVRRRFLDIEISQTSPFYCHNLVKYNRVLSQRNILLKAIREKREKAELLNVWDTQLANYGSSIIKKRVEVLEKIGPIASSIHSEITGGREVLYLSYMPSLNIQKLEKGMLLEEYFFEKLKENRSTDIIKGITMLGPHRDDIGIKIGDIDIRAYGSQGQQRTCAVSMKLSEIEFIKKEIGEYPILLLDDVLSELDTGRRRALLGAVKAEVQKFITTTEISGIVKTIKNNSRVFKVKSGKIFLLQEG